MTKASEGITKTSERTTKVEDLGARSAEKISDERLVELSRQGEGQATEEILRRYTGAVRGVARGFFLAGGETEDLIQEGMMGLCRAITDFKEGEKHSSFKNFAYLCIKRRILDAVKASARKKNTPLNNYVAFSEDWEVPGFSPEEELINSENRREFMQKISKELSDAEFRITVMYMDGMSCAEICEATGRNEKSVDNAIQRSKRKLQKILKR